jgi:hypothetical protein
MDVPPVTAQVHYKNGLRGSNSVEIMNDSKPYEITRALDSDDDRLVGELLILEERVSGVEEERGDEGNSHCVGGVSWS